MDISIDVVKAFDKMQHPFIVLKKTHSKLGIEGDILNVVKGIYKKPNTHNKW